MDNQEFPESSPRKYNTEEEEAWYTQDQVDKIKEGIPEALEKLSSFSRSKWVAQMK